MPTDALHAPEVGARLRHRREQLGLSREGTAGEFRRRTGTTTSTNTVARWEATGSLKVQELIEMAALLDCDPGWLLVGAPGGREVLDLEAALEEVLGDSDDPQAGEARS